MDKLKNPFGNKDKEEEKKDDAKPEEKKEEKSSESMKFMTMKTGMYNVHVYIERTRNLTDPDTKEGDVSDLINPLVQVQCFGKVEASKAKEDIGTEDTYWGKHIHIENVIEVNKLKKL